MGEKNDTDNADTNATDGNVADFAEAKERLRNGEPVNEAPSIPDLDSDRLLELAEISEFINFITLQLKHSEVPFDGFLLSLKDMDGGCHIAYGSRGGSEFGLVNAAGLAAEAQTNILLNIAMGVPVEDI